MSLAHHNLVAWQRADDLFIEIHRLTHQRFPASERLGYIDSATCAELEQKVAMIAGPLRGLIRRCRQRAVIQAGTVLLIGIGMLLRR